ncbi:NUDIX hydrolase [Rhodococcus sp. X156]|uniref:NUDIX domain-containing protein n=1 Tax=Rhodococcus sp. X156 TaxID=2499145 RepID=UPI001F49D0D0|nr:NUDIX hydrolase [Rhodococcus sp. X156]
MSEPGAHDFSVADSQVVYRGAILALRADQVRMPGGDTSTREVVEHHASVAVVALDEADQVVLIHQYRHPLGRRLWELPAGLLDVADEEPLPAAQRELAEEVGLAAQRWSVLVDIDPSPGFCDESMRVYLAEGLSEVDRPDPEHEEADLVVQRVPLVDAVRRVLSGDIVNCAAVSGLLALSAARATGTPLRTPDAEWTDQSFALLRRGEAAHS